MKNILSAIVILILLSSCEKELIVPVYNNANNDNTELWVDNRMVSTYPHLTILYDSLSRYKQISQNALIDFDNNGRYDMITMRHNQSVVGTKINYELLDPYIVMDDGTIKDITNMWKGGSELTSGDYNGDGYKDIAVFDNGPDNLWNIVSNPDKTPVTVYWGDRGGPNGEKTIVTNVYDNSFVLVSGKISNTKDVLILGKPNSETYYEFNGTEFVMKSFPTIDNIGRSQQGGWTMNQHSYEDVNNDGVSDLIYFCVEKPKIVYDVFNTAKSSFTFEDMPSGYLSARAMTGDFRKVGRKDIIFIAQRVNVDNHFVLENKHYYFYYENNGNGSFTLNKEIMPVDGTPYKTFGLPNFVVADCNFDGYLDLFNVNASMNAFFKWDKQTNKFKVSNRSWQ
jgi:hypothetical protein